LCVFENRYIGNMSEFQCISVRNKWQWQEKRSDVTWYKTEVRNKILFFYTVQSLSILNKGTLIFWSQFVLYLTLFTFPLHTHTHIIYIANGQYNWFYLWHISDLISKFSHNHKYIYYTFQFVISISQINNTISRGQLWAIQCALK